MFHLLSQQIEFEWLDIIMENNVALRNTIKIISLAERTVEAPTSSLIHVLSSHAPRHWCNIDCLYRQQCLHAIMFEVRLEISSVA